MIFHDLLTNYSISCLCHRLVSHNCKISFPKLCPKHFVIWIVSLTKDSKQHVKQTQRYKPTTKIDTNNHKEMQSNGKQMHDNYKEVKQSYKAAIASEQNEINIRMKFYIFLSYQDSRSWSVHSLWSKTGALNCGFLTQDEWRLSQKYPASGKWKLSAHHQSNPSNWSAEVWFTVQSHSVEINKIVGWPAYRYNGLSDIRMSQRLMDQYEAIVPKILIKGKIRFCVSTATVPGVRIVKDKSRIT